MPARDRVTGPPQILCQVLLHLGCGLVEQPGSLAAELGHGCPNPGEPTQPLRAPDAIRLNSRKENLLAMVSKEMLLVRVERRGARRFLRVQPHARQGNHVGHRRNQNLAVVVEADESTVKKVIRCRRKEQPVCNVKALLVRGLAPGLDVAPNQVCWVIHERQAAPLFKPGNSVPE